MKLISIKEAREIWDKSNGNPGEALWVLSGEYNEDDEPLLTTIAPRDGFPNDAFLFFVSTSQKPATDYLETFYEVVARFYSDTENEKLLEIENSKGRGGMWEFAEDLTNEFQKLHEDTIWGEKLDWMETLENFLNERLK